MNQVTEVHNTTTDLITTNRQKEVRAAIQQFESDIRSQVEDNIGIITTHHFAGGCCSREMFVPKGTSFTGRIHRNEYLNILQKGKVVLVTEDGATVLTAPHTWVGRSGTKVTAHALEDTVWSNIIRTDSNSVKDIESQEIVESYEQLEHEWETGITPRPKVSTEEFLPFKDEDGSWVVNENLKITVEGIDTNMVNNLVEQSLLENVL